MKNQNRRSFLKLSALSAGFLGLSTTSSYSYNQLQDKIEELAVSKKQTGKSVMDLAVAPIEQVRVGIIGVGNRGYSHVRTINSLSPKAKIVAICDARKSRITRALDLLTELNGKKEKIATYSGNEEVWKDMVKRDDIDLVVVITPAPVHARMAIYAMQQGKHVVSEVPITLTIEESWELVNTAEETQRHCMMLENVSYGEEELWILNMVRNNVFGTLTHGEAGYLHHLLEKLFSNSPDPKDSAYYKQWRLRLHAEMSGNLYPTHGLGPVANYMKVGRGDKFDYLVSMDSNNASLSEYSKVVSPDNEFYNRINFAHGDMSSALIKTAKNRTILLQHDVVSPRPYSRKNVLAGTQAYHEGYPSRLALYEDDHGHNWLNDDKYNELRKKYQHPIWTKMKKEAEENGGHGGMDYLEFYRLFTNLNKGVSLDMDIYDGINWSVIVPLTKLSNELGSVPVKFPDFTRGDWKKERELGYFKHI
ncbi:MAG: Gfo/Idh/MocA family oxidoreductase [Draconibacterium sp.]|nr:Gfo/Idh/MocA family oxidoreductase [Draconibacterium sp.]